MAPDIVDCVYSIKNALSLQIHKLQTVYSRGSCKGMVTVVSRNS